MEKIVLDTCYLCSLLNEKDVNNSLAIEIAKNLKDCLVLVPTVVIAELMSNFRNKHIRDITVGATFKIVDDTPSIDRDNIAEYVEFAKHIPHSFTAIDSTILFLTKENNAKLITFDEKLLKLYKTI